MCQAGKFQAQDKPMEIQKLKLPHAFGFLKILFDPGIQA
jgi:hypothetical protein